MELQDFITETIKSITNGVINAQEFDTENGTLVNPIGGPYDKLSEHSLIIKGNGGGQKAITKIDFDIAVTVSSEDTTKVGGGLKIQIFNADASTASNITNQTTSRIKFQVNVALPSTKNTQ